MPSRLAILMMADLVDYSRIMDSDPSMAIEAIRSLRTTYLEPVSESHGGQVLKRMGDGWMISYPSAVSAVNCAMEVQSNLSSHETIKLRIGAHLGEILEEEDDFYGSGANVTQRIQTEAPPGGVMVSQDLFRQLPGTLSEKFADAGSFKLKNIALPLNLYQWRPNGFTGTRDSDVPTISVGRFASAPETSEAQSACDDLRDQLLSRLSRRTGIRVLDEVSRRSDVAVYQLRGRFRLSPSRARLNLSLTRRADAVAVWSRSYEGDPSDFFALCDDIVDRADSDLRIQINAFDGDRIADLPDSRLSVSELRSRAANEFYKLTIGSWEYARDLIERALRLKPDDPMALCMRAEAAISLALANFDHLDEDSAASIQGDLDTAVEASPRSDYAFCLRSFFRLHVRRDALGALEDSSRSLALSPAYAPAHEITGLCHMFLQNHSAAEKALARALELSQSDPFLPGRAYGVAINYLLWGQSEKAAEIIDQAVQLRPRLRAFWALKSECLRTAGREAEATASFDRARELPREPSIYALRPPLPSGTESLLALLSPR